MERASLVEAICKLAIAGERAGFSLEQMIQLLNAGLTVESLIELSCVAGGTRKATGRVLMLDYLVVCTG